MVNEGIIASSDVWLNDKYVPVAALWKCIAENVSELVERIVAVRKEHGIGSRELFDANLKKLRMPLSDIEMAEALFIVNRLCGDTFLLGELYYYSPWNNLNGGLRKNAIENLRDVGMLMRGCNVTCGYYQAVVPQSSGSLLFLDPPYRLGVKKETRFYGAPFQHQRFATWCHRMKNRCSIMITYDDSDAHLANFKGWHIYRHGVLFRKARDWRKEMIITNYEIPYPSMLDDDWELAA